MTKSNFGSAYPDSDQRSNHMFLGTFQTIIKIPSQHFE